MDFERLIRAAPVQERFRPTMPELLAPRVDSLPTLARRGGAVIALVIIAALIAVALRARNPVFSYPHAPVPFSAPYAHPLALESAPPRALLLLAQHDAAGLVASFEVTPLRLPRYPGEISGLLPVYAANYIRRTAAAVGPTFQLQSQGRTRILALPAYTFTYARQLGSRAFYGRVVFITPDLRGDTHGLVLSMLELRSAVDAAAAPAPATPDTVGTVGPLAVPLEHLHLG